MDEPKYRLSIEHPDCIEAASQAFWEACRVELGRAVEQMKEPWRDPIEEFERVRDAVRKGMREAMKVANRMHHEEI